MTRQKRLKLHAHLSPSQPGKQKQIYIYIYIFVYTYSIHTPLVQRTIVLRSWFHEIWRNKLCKTHPRVLNPLTPLVAYGPGTGKRLISPSSCGGHSPHPHGAVAVARAEFHRFKVSELRALFGAAPPEQLPADLTALPPLLLKATAWLRASALLGNTFNGGGLPYALGPLTLQSTPGRKSRPTRPSGACPSPVACRQ